MTEMRVGQCGKILQFMLFACAIFASSISLISCAATSGAESAGGDSGAKDESSERELQKASKEQESTPSDSPKGSSKAVVVTLKNAPSFQGSIPNQVLTDSLVAMEEVVQKNPKDVGIMITYLGLLRMHGQGGQIYDSILRKAGPLGSNNPWFLLEAGYGALVRRDFGLAEFLLGKAEKSAKGMADAGAAIRHAFGVNYLLQDRVQQGVFEMKQAANATKPYLPALLTLGYMGLRYGDYIGAERSFRAAVAAEGKNVNARMGLAIALRVKGSPGDALGMMQSIYNEDNNDRRIVWNYALTLSEVNGKEKEALAILEKYFQLPGSFPELDAKATQLMNKLQAKSKS